MKSQQEAARKRSYSETIVHDDTPFDPLPRSKNFLVNNYYVSNAFCKMQLSSSMSILYLSPNNYPEEVKPFFKKGQFIYFCIKSFKRS